MREDKQVQKKDDEDSANVIAFPKTNKRVFEAIDTVQELEETVIANKTKFVEKTFKLHNCCSCLFRRSFRESRDSPGIYVFSKTIGLNLFNKLKIKNNKDKHMKLLKMQQSTSETS